jgi:hypothetical protein
VYKLRDQIQSQAAKMSILQGEISKMIVESSRSPRSPGGKKEESKYFKKDMSTFMPAPGKNINQQISHLNQELMSTTQNIEAMKLQLKEEKLRAEQL